MSKKPKISSKPAHMHHQSKPDLNDTPKKPKYLYFNILEGKGKLKVKRSALHKLQK